MFKLSLNASLPHWIIEMPHKMAEIKIKFLQFYAVLPQFHQNTALVLF